MTSRIKPINYQHHNMLRLFHSFFINAYGAFKNKTVCHNDMSTPVLLENGVQVNIDLYNI